MGFKESDNIVEASALLKSVNIGRTTSTSYPQSMKDINQIPVCHMDKVECAGGDCGAWLCSAIISTPSTGQREMEDSHHSAGRGVLLF